MTGERYDYGMKFSLNEMTFLVGIDQRQRTCVNSYVASFWRTTSEWIEKRSRPTQLYQICGWIRAVWRWHNIWQTTQHNTTQHNTTQHNTTQHNTTQHNTTQHNTTQHNTTQHNTTQHNTTPHTDDDPLIMTHSSWPTSLLPARVTLYRYQVTLSCCQRYSLSSVA